jgi:prepilin-type N-terminal cleavage/methylation domain-containing protein
MRQGFTLLELLLTTSILVVLLGIVGSVMVAFARMETQRALHSEQQRIARTWKQILNNDFRAAIQDTEQFNKTVGDETIRHFGVSGTATQLRIDISDYSWRSAESSELRTIFYEFHQTSGLIRRERDYAALKSVEGAMQVAPEIVSGSFRYFDGSTWHDQWSSLDRKSAPAAMEVIFYSLSRAEADRWRRQESDAKEPLLNRVSVQVPSASSGISEAYTRAQPPRPPQENLPPPPSSPPSPVPSWFGDD